MAKNRRGGKDKEWDEVQRLKQENKKLRAQVSKLRNVVSNIDTSHYRFVQELLDSEVFAAEEQDAANRIQKKVEQQWQCHTCGKGVMRLIILNRVGEAYYLRRCDHCDQRTKLKKYTDDVKGA